MQLAQGIKQLRHYCQEFGRDPDSVLIVARPGRVYPINTETQAQHLALGIHHLIIDPPLDGPDLNAFRSEMERVAAVCGLPPRHQKGGGDA
jgi:alkanesulfonate monooxygenase SsuD/methylene tetrahydromethanopterin reductase-like flavin-dependent oxidoreductase (luciferase family)